jgi:hypothetical protein
MASTHSKLWHDKLSQKFYLAACLCLEAGHPNFVHVHACDKIIDSYGVYLIITVSEQQVPMMVQETSPSVQADMIKAAKFFLTTTQDQGHLPPCMVTQIFPLTKTSDQEFVTFNFFSWFSYFVW